MASCRVANRICSSAPSMQLSCSKQLRNSFLKRSQWEGHVLLANRIYCSAPNKQLPCSNQLRNLFWSVGSRKTKFHIHKKDIPDVYKCNWIWSLVLRCQWDLLAHAKQQLPCSNQLRTDSFLKRSQWENPIPRFHVHENHAGCKCNWIWFDVALPVGFVRHSV